MALPDSAFWSELVRRALASYDEPLLRQVAGRLLKPRNQWPVDDLIERSVATLDNPAVLDRRLLEVESSSRQVLALIAHSRQPCWNFGNLVEMTLALGHQDGLAPVLALLEAGLLFPTLGGEPGGRGLPTTGVRLKTFEQWLGFPGPGGLLVFTPPVVAARALGEDLGLPDLTKPLPVASGEEDAVPSPPPVPFPTPTAIMEADGLEWLLRLAVLWQQVAAGPLRRTQQGGFFKRDVERLGQDPLLTSPPADKLVDVPDPGFLVEALAEWEGVVVEVEGELRAGRLPPSWDVGLGSALESLWTGLPRLESWNALDGWRGGEETVGNPYPSAGLLAFMLLARLPSDAFIRPSAVEAWLVAHHPYWQGASLKPSRREGWLQPYLLGVAYHLRLVQAARDPSGGYGVRLAPAGRWLLGLAYAPPAETGYTQTLLVQPNLEIIAFRQGMTVSLLARLTRCAAWKSLGAACTLQLEPDTVYRALEAGETFDSIRLTLEQHGTRSIPPAVLDSLRTWANKRDRITVYPSATLLEFGSADELNEALARGLRGHRVSDTLAVVLSEDGIDFRHFRLTGTRDYALPPERCVTIESDGVTLSVDLARSDLLLDTELPRFAEPQGKPSAEGKRQYRLTPASLAAARESGLNVVTLETWFQQRTGQPLSPAARLLLTAGQGPPPQLRRHLVMHVAAAELADGLTQWPATSELIAERLGPTVLAVEDEDLPLLLTRLKEAGIVVAGE